MENDQLVNNLKALGYTVTTFNSKEEVVNYLCESLKETTIGFGGSMTAKELNLYEELKVNNKTYWHWIKDDELTPEEVDVRENNSEIYICSANAVSLNGEIVNIDGTGNRIASSLYGHKKVIMIIGKNKICENLDKAISRARNIAAPLNAKRLGKKVPCIFDMKCHDCKSSERICRALSVFYRKPTGSDYEIILVDEELGY